MVSNLPALAHALYPIVEQTAYRTSLQGNLEANDCYM